MVHAAWLLTVARWARLGRDGWVGSKLMPIPLKVVVRFKTDECQV